MLARTRVRLTTKTEFKSSQTFHQTIYERELNNTMRVQFKLENLKSFEPATQNQHRNKQFTPRTPQVRFHTTHSRQKKLCSRQQPRLILMDKTPWPACSACGCATARIKPSVRKSNTEMTNRNHPVLRKAKSSPTEAGRRTHARSGHTPSRRQNHGDSIAARFEAGTEKPRKKLQINRGAGNRALGTCSHAS
jgi:hypothetical protein